MNLDVYIKKELTGTKDFIAAKSPLSKWIDRPKGTITRPPLNGAIKGIGNNTRIYTDKLSLDAIGYIRFVSNDIQNSGKCCFFLSSPYNGLNGWSILPTNFEASLICFTISQLVIPTWLNDKDEFSVPNTNHENYNQFKNDAIVWALFNGANQSSSLGNIEYKDKVYDIKNEFFFLTKEEFLKIEDMPHSIITHCNHSLSQVSTGISQERYVSKWLKDKVFSADVQEILELGKELVRVSAWARLHGESKYQLDRWDAGWYQIRMGLYGKDTKFEKSDIMLSTFEKFKTKYKALTIRLRPYIYELGFLPKDNI